MIRAGALHSRTSRRRRSTSSSCVSRWVRAAARASAAPVAPARPRALRTTLPAVRAQLAVISALLLLGDRTDGGCHRYVEWLTALLAVVTLAGQDVHADGYSVDAGYIGRTIQRCYNRWKQHENKPQLTFRIIWHCSLLLRKMPKLFTMPECLRWVRPTPATALRRRCRSHPAGRRCVAGTCSSRLRRSPRSRASSA